MKKNQSHWTTPPRFSPGLKRDEMATFPPFSLHCNATREVKN